ncbi:MAG: hypothetical protein R6U51_00625 [Anaerolineales bacterium]
MTVHNFSGIIFVTPVLKIEQRKSVQMLINSIRILGGPLRESEIWIFDSSPHADLCGSMEASNPKTIKTRPDAFLETCHFLVCTPAGKMASQRLGL